MSETSVSVVTDSDLLPTGTKNIEQPKKRKRFKESFMQRWNIMPFVTFFVLWEVFSQLNEKICLV